MIFTKADALVRRSVSLAKNVASVAPRMAHSKARAGLLAAASLAVIAAAPNGANAAPAPLQNAMEQAAIVEPATPAMEAAASSDADAARKLGLGAAALGVLALLYRLIGRRRLKAAIDAAAPVIAETAKTAAKAAVKAPAIAVRAAASVFSAPLKYGLGFGGLSLVGILGFGFYDIEWLGGIAVGAALVGMSWIGVGKARAAFAPRPAVARQPETHSDDG